MFLNMNLHVKNDSKMFFINDVFDADEYLSSYSHNAFRDRGSLPP